MKLIEHSNLLGYVVAADYEKRVILYYSANILFSNELITNLNESFYKWGVLLCNDVEVAISFANNDEEVIQAINCVAAENI